MKTSLRVLIVLTLCLTATAQTPSATQPKALTKNADVEVFLSDVFWTGMTTSNGEGALRSDTPTDSVCLLLSCSLISDKEIDIVRPGITANGKAINYNAYFLMSLGGTKLAIPVAEAKNPLNPKHRKSGIFLVIKRSELQLKDSASTIRITNLLNLPAIDVTFAMP